MSLTRASSAEVPSLFADWNDWETVLGRTGLQCLARLQHLGLGSSLQALLTVDLSSLAGPGCWLLPKALSLLCCAKATKAVSFFQTRNKVQALFYLFPPPSSQDELPGQELALPQTISPARELDLPKQALPSADITTGTKALAQRNTLAITKREAGQLPL